MAEKEFEEVERKIDLSETQGSGGGGGESTEQQNAPETEEKPTEESVEESKEENEEEKEKTEPKDGGDGEGDEKDLVGRICVIIEHGIGRITSKKGEIYIVKSTVDKLNHPIERFGLAVSGDEIIYQKKPFGDLQKAKILNIRTGDNSIDIKYTNEFGETITEIEPLQIRKLVENENPTEGKDGDEKDPLIGKTCGIFWKGQGENWEGYGKVCVVIGKKEMGDYILREINGTKRTYFLGRMWFAVMGDCVQIKRDGETYFDIIKRIQHSSREYEAFKTSLGKWYNFQDILSLSDKCEQFEKPKEEDKLSLIGQTCVVLFGDFKGESGQIIRMTDNGFDIDLDSGNGSGTWARINFAVVGDCVYFNRIGGGTSTERIQEFIVKDKTWLPEGMDVWHNMTSIIRLSENCPPKEEPKPEEESSKKIFTSSSVQFCRFVTEQVFEDFDVLKKFGNKPFLNDVIYSFLISTFSYRYSTLNWGEAVDIYNEIWMYDQHQFDTSNPNEKSEYERIIEIDNLLFEELVSIVPKISDALDDQYQADFIYNAMQAFTGGMPFAFVYDTLGELFTVARIDEEARFIVSSVEHPTKLNYLYKNGTLLNWVIVEREFLKIDEVASLIRKMCKNRSKYVIGTTLGNVNMLVRIKDVVEQFSKTI